MTKKVRIGSHSAMWGDWPKATAQLLNGGNIQYLVGDYLAEVTMAILAKQKARKPETAGYATDFVTAVMKTNMKELKKQGVKVIVNAGGIAPLTCRDALLAEAKRQGIELKVGVVLGDDLMDRTDEFRNRKVCEMYSGQPFPGKKTTMSCNAYLGAFPIADALRQGCEVVITGRVVDSALVLAPLIFEFGWTFDMFDQLAAGTLAGHLIECGAQGTGGLFTDYERVENWANIGYPIVEVEASGQFIVTKPPNTGGLVCFGSVCEQMLYEIQDPGCYHVPDVACDFTQVCLTEVGDGTVRVSNVRGLPPTDTYKVCTTHSTGWKYHVSMVVVGHNAADKARRTGETLLIRYQQLVKEAGLPAFTETRVEAIGGGEYFRNCPAQAQSREVLMRISCRHPNKKAFGLLKREVASVTVSMPQGWSLGGSEGITEVVSSYMHLEPKNSVTAAVDVHGVLTKSPVPTTGGFTKSASESVVAVKAVDPNSLGRTMKIPLLELCYARSGDKGDKANIGLIARRKEYLPVIRNQVTAEKVKEYFSYKCKGEVVRYDLPGPGAMNFMLDQTLGGGGTTSLHADPLAKTYGQVLLGMEIDAPVAWQARIKSAL